MCLTYNNFVKKIWLKYSKFLLFIVNFTRIDYNRFKLESYKKILRKNSKKKYY